MMNKLLNKIWSILSFTVILSLLISCNKEDKVLPVAEFQADKDTLSYGESVKLTITDYNPLYYYCWKYGSYSTEADEETYTTSFSSNSNVNSISLIAINEYGADSCTKTFAVGDYSPIKCTGTIIFYETPALCEISLYEYYNSANEDLVLNISPSSFSYISGYYRYNYSFTISQSDLHEVDLGENNIKFKVSGRSVSDYNTTIKVTNFTPNSDHEFTYSCTFN